MTEKRFEPIANDDGFVEYIRDTQIGLLTFDEFIDTANALHEEKQDNEAMIEFLSTENSQIRDEIKTRTQIQHQLEEENEQLKFERDDYQNDAIKFEKECKRLANNLRLTAGDWKYEQLMHKKLEKENEQLKQEMGDLRTAHAEEITKIEDEFDKENLRLIKEIKQLKADNNRLVNETAKIVAEHQGRVLELIDKSLEKDKQYYEMSYEDYLNGRIEALEELKKELQE